MNISIRKPIGYTHIGRKDRQEDAVWPAFDDVSADNRVIVLCDGVGGSAHGEVASQTAAKVIGEYLSALAATKDIVTEEDMQAAVSAAYDALDKVDTGDAVGGQPSMATTLTCVCIHKEGILAAHMGDSRIYLVRPNQGLLYQSSDHSLVNALLQAGELTPEEAKNFPRKNVIIKALQPHPDKRLNAEVHQLTDIRTGDYVFLCCDGVLEQLSNERLVEILSMDCSDQQKLALLEAESTDRTRDNYTAYLIPIDKVEGVSNIMHDNEVEAVDIQQPHRVTPPPLIVPPHNMSGDTEVTRPLPTGPIPMPSPPHIPNDNPPTGPDTGKKPTKAILMGVALIAVLAIVFLLGRNSLNWFGKPDTPTAVDDRNDRDEASDRQQSTSDRDNKKDEGFFGGIWSRITGSDDPDEPTTNDPNAPTGQNENPGQEQTGEGTGAAGTPEPTNDPSVNDVQNPDGTPTPHTEDGTGSKIEEILTDIDLNNSENDDCPVPAGSSTTNHRRNRITFPGHKDSQYTFNGKETVKYPV